MATVAQRSFAAGEIAPSLYARADQVKYATGLRICRNFMVMRHGGVQNRPGTGFVGEVKDSTKTVRLIPFVFNSDQTYVLEFGNLYMRVVRSGAQVSDLTLTITGVSNANPGVVTYTGTDPVNGEEVYISGVVGAMAQYINGRSFKIANVNAGANTFELQDMSSANVDTSGWGAYTSGGTAARIYTITTPYVEAHLQDLQFVQSGDTVTIVHPSYAPRQLTRTGHSTWTLAAITFEPSISRPTACAGTAGGAGTGTYRYKVTASKADTYEESLPGTQAAVAITGITQANPAVVSAAGHGYSNGDEVLITGVLGMTEVNDRVFVVAGVTANTFELKDVNSTSYTAYSSGGSALRTSIVIGSAAAPTASAPHALTWTAVANAFEYNVYKESAGVYGLIGVSQSASFNDTGLTADTKDGPPAPLVGNLFKLSGDFPSAVAFYQQRLGFANSDNNPETSWFGRSAQSKNFTRRLPAQSDDALQFRLTGRQVNEIRHMVELNKLVIFTSGGEWTIEGSSAGILTPSEVNPKQHSYNGASSLAPIIIGGNALYVQARGSIVRDLGFDYQVEGYRGNDLTIFSAHLFDGYTLRDWTYQQVPHSIIWIARSDGKLLGLTYIREHQMVGWHRHDFDGTVEQVCAIPEGTEDALYLVIKRTINGATKRYIERMKTRQISDIVDAVFVDCSLSRDGENAGATTMTLTGGTDWTFDEVLTLTASASFFESTDVGNQIWLRDASGDEVRLTITAYTSATEVSVTPHKTVPVTLRAAARTTWSEAVDELTGLWHLEGKSVSVFADGAVVANPNNSSYNAVTVANGKITLDAPHVVIHVGLPITSDLQTLDMDSAESPLADKKKLVTRVDLQVESSRGIWIGGMEPASDSSYEDQLTEAKVRSDEDYSVVALTTGIISVNIRPEWNSHGRVFVRQTDPLPLAVLGVVPSGFIPAGR